MRPVARLDGDIGKSISRRAFGEQTSQGLLGIGGLKKRTVRFLADAGRQDLELRLQPDRDALRGDVVPCRLVHERAAAGGEHLRPGFQKARDDLALPVAEIGFAEPLEDFRDRQLGARLDLGVGVDEGQPELRGQPPADRGLAGPHHADEHDRATAERIRHPLRLDRLTLNHEPFAPRISV